MLTIEEKKQLSDTINQFREDLKVIYSSYKTILKKPRKQKKKEKKQFKILIDLIFKMVCNRINSIISNNEGIDIKDPYEFLTKIFKDVNMYKKQNSNNEQVQI